MHAVELSNSTWALRLLPAWGGRIAGLCAGGLELLLPIVSDTFDPLDWPRAGAYPLMPYSNRLRHARLASTAPSTACRRIRRRGRIPCTGSATPSRGR